MKRIATILLTFFYLIPAIGFSFDIHWCGNKVRSVSIIKAHGEKCPCGMKMKAGCCKDVHTNIKLSESQKGSSQIVSPNNSITKYLTEFSIKNNLTLYPKTDVIDIANYHSPPAIRRLPVFLLNSNFRI